MNKLENRSEDKSEECIERKFEKVFSQLGEVNPIFSMQTKNQMVNMVEQIAKSNNNFQNITGTDQSNAVKGGFAAEEWHAESHNLDAILNDDSTRLYTDEYSEWYENSFKKNDTPDLIAVKDGEVIHQSQAKYYQNAEKTSKAMRGMKDGQVKYGDMDSLLGPSDQVNPEDGSKSIADYAERTSMKESGPNGRANVKEAAEQIQDKATDKINTGKSKSTQLTKKQAEKLGKVSENADFKRDMENRYQTKSTLQQMGKAAVGAASISAIISGTYNTVRYCKLVRDGKMSQEIAVCKIIAETASSASDSAIKASAVAGSHSLIVRYGSKELVKNMTKQGLKGMIRSNVVSVGVICAIDTVKDLVKLGAGRITKDQFYDRQGKNILNTTSGVTGASIGFSTGSATAISLGVAANSTTALVLGSVGALSGGLIAGLAMQIAVENHIEKAYADILRNTENLQDSMKILQNVSLSIFKGQALFTEFLKEEKTLDKKFETKILDIDLVGNKMQSAINLI
ncbi:hypothetical protein QUF76_05030 [Desulfobacterales bacterium HSG16]|nr:hypothetical protein [Desulfobacterales bacterium HSG16]